jgi:hypothetical protein
LVLQYLNRSLACAVADRAGFGGINTFLSGAVAVGAFDFLFHVKSPVQSIDGSKKGGVAWRGCQMLPV